MTACTICRDSINLRSRAREALAAVGIGSAYDRRTGLCWPCWHAITDKPEIMPEDERRELGYVTRDCPICFVDHHDREDDRNIGLNWYYCGGCGTEWCEDPAKARNWRTVDVAINLAWVVFLAAGLLATMVTTAWVARHDWHWSHDAASWASFWLGAPAWLATVIAATTIARWITNAIHAGIDYLWGEPLS